MNPILILAGFTGFSAIALGAYGDHGLRGVLDEHTMRSFETAVRYQLFHALALLAISIGISCTTTPALSKKLFWCGAVVFIGTALFSGSIYTSIILDIQALTKITPTGGIVLMIGWLMLIWCGITKSASKP